MGLYFKKQKQNKSKQLQNYLQIKPTNICRVNIREI